MLDHDASIDITPGQRLLVQVKEIARYMGGQFGGEPRAMVRSSAYRSFYLDDAYPELAADQLLILEAVKIMVTFQSDMTVRHVWRPILP